MLEFDKIFIETLSTYGQEINQHFGRKPTGQRLIIKERILRQVVKNKSFSKNKKASKVLTNFMLGDTGSSKIQAFINLLNYIQTGSKTFTSYEKETLKRLTKEITSHTQIVSKIIGIDSLSIDPHELIENRINEILNINDKSLFNELLKSDFYKSIVKSYVPRTDSKAVLLRTVLPILLKPENSKELLANLPELFDSENEIINQLYGKSPFILNSIFKSLNKYKSPNLAASIINFTDKISKKQTNKLLNSFYSYYSSLSIQLNELNKYIAKTSYSELLSYVSKTLLDINIKPNTVPTSTNKYAHSQLLILIASSNKSPQSILTKYLELTQAFLLSKKVIKSKAEALKVFYKLPKVKDRSFSVSEKEDEIILQSLEQEQKVIKQRTKEVAIYSLKTLLQDYYLPTDFKQTVMKSKVQESKVMKSNVQKSKAKGEKNSITEAKKVHIISTKNTIINETKVTLKKGLPALLKQLKSHKIPKKEIQEIFSNKKILKNPVLSKITTQSFKDILELALPTDKARLYYKLFDKYKQYFRIHVNNEQVQLIFLSLINSHQQLTEANIFKLYFEELKKLKGWTYDVHKKNLINMYESKVEYFTEEEKNQLIKYIDEIPTYVGLELRDTKKKLEEGIPVKNAGLCLLWPFFKTLFNISGYLDQKGEFKNVEMRERATLLLQYLAVKSTDIEEPYLALNKIFTGLPLEESLPKGIVLTEKEKDIADGLLLNVIKQWPSFENSSTDNLRGSFIIRDGVLFFRGKQWILRVERKAYDLLLGKLPWGYSMIRLSWVPYMIKVEWD